ncbi:hypothetical protein [Mycobacterium sp. PSTR-4-N]|uniref:hypothetical protein n=1 Tax=Mycobacterium sp. PSTR-4-N TaxID=2917745 RepID=UPI001F14CFD1|nr:hypothetical protein [Mycobacterium sp. PSTR-4-N]
MTLFDHLDVFGIGNEGQPEDRCDTCGRPVDEHQGRPARRASTVWIHRWHALRAFL